MRRRSIAGSISNFFRKHREKRYIHRKLLADEYRFSLSATRIFSSRGIIENCDVHADMPRSSLVAEDFIRSIPSRCDRIGNCRDPVSIYICTDSIVFFVNEVLENISCPFVLVTGDSDLSVSKKTIANIDALLANPYLVKWYAQNLECTHSKVSPMPIGLDFHSAWQNPRHYRGSHILPSLQEGELRSISSAAKRFSERDPRVMCDWIGHSTYGDREEASQKIPKEVRVVPTQRLPRHELWREYTKYAFVASPFGVGLDCHRTWEAIALGCVPIIKSSQMAAQLFEDMPVLIIEDWAQVTAEYLTQQHKKLASQQFDYSKLFLNFWTQKIRFNQWVSQHSSSIDDMWLLV